MKGLYVEGTVEIDAWRDLFKWARRRGYTDMFVLCAHSVQTYYPSSTLLPNGYGNNGLLRALDRQSTRWGIEVHPVVQCYGVPSWLPLGVEEPALLYIDGEWTHVDKRGARWIADTEPARDRIETVCDELQGLGKIHLDYFRDYGWAQWGPEATDESRQLAADSRSLFLEDLVNNHGVGSVSVIRSKYQKLSYAQDWFNWPFALTVMPMIYGTTLPEARAEIASDLQRVRCDYVPTFSAYHDFAHELEEFSNTFPRVVEYWVNPLR